MLTSQMVFSSIPHLGFASLLFAFQLCFQQVLQNSTLGHGRWQPGCCLLPAEQWMFPSGSVQPPKVTFDSSSHDWESCCLFLFSQRRLLNFWWKTCTVQEFTEKKWQFSKQNWLWRSVLANFVATLLVMQLSGVKVVGGWKTFSLSPTVFRPGSSIA